MLTLPHRRFRQNKLLLGCLRHERKSTLLRLCLQRSSGRTLQPQPWPGRRKYQERKEKTTSRRTMSGYQKDRILCTPHVDPFRFFYEGKATTAYRHDTLACHGLGLVVLQLAAIRLPGCCSSGRDNLLSGPSTSTNRPVPAAQSW